MRPSVRDRCYKVKHANATESAEGQKNGEDVRVSTMASWAVGSWQLFVVCNDAAGGRLGRFNRVVVRDGEL